MEWTKSKTSRFIPHSTEHRAVGKNKDDVYTIQNGFNYRLFTGRLRVPCSNYIGRFKTVKVAKEVAELIDKHRIG